MSAPRKAATKAKKTAETRRAAVLRDLEARKADAIKGGFGQTNRFDPYRNYRFRPA
jgi:hypothetical protein